MGRSISHGFVDLAGNDWGGYRLNHEYVPVGHQFGKGEFDVRRHRTDLVLNPFDSNSVTNDYLPSGYDSTQPIQFPKDFTADKYCSKDYQTDIITLDSMDDLYKQKHGSVGWTPQKRCWNLGTLISFWNSALATFDPQSARVVPQYPKDPNTRDRLMTPYEIVNMYQRAVDTKEWSPKSSTPIDLLISTDGLIEDLYRFLMAYDRLTIYYATADPSKDEQAKWNRRDLQALNWLRHLYVKYKIDKNSGYRRFTDIASGKNSPEISLSCFLTALLIRKGFVARFVSKELDKQGYVTSATVQWVKLNNKQKICESSKKGTLCRPCATKWIIPKSSTKYLISSRNQENT